MTKNVLLLNSDKTEILLIGQKKQYTEYLGSQFATRWMCCYFLYSKKSGCYIRQQPIFWIGVRRSDIQDQYRFDIAIFCWIGVSVWRDRSKFDILHS